MRISKGDKVVVRSGKYKGQRAEVVRALPAEDKVIVDGVNVAKRHAKPTRNTMQGGIIDKFMPVPVSSVSIVCKTCGDRRGSACRSTSRAGRFVSAGSAEQSCDRHRLGAGPPPAEGALRRPRSATSSRTTSPSTTSWRCPG